MSNSTRLQAGPRSIITKLRYRYVPVSKAADRRLSIAAAESRNKGASSSPDPASFQPVPSGTPWSRGSTVRCFLLPGRSGNRSPATSARSAPRGETGLHLTMAVEGADKIGDRHREALAVDAWLSEDHTHVMKIAARHSEVNSRPLSWPGRAVYSGTAVTAALFVTYRNMSTHDETPSVRAGLPSGPSSPPRDELARVLDETRANFVATFVTECDAIAAPSSSGFARSTHQTRARRAAPDSDWRSASRLSSSTAVASAWRARQVPVARSGFAWRRTRRMTRRHREGADHRR